MREEEIFKKVSEILHENLVTGHSKSKKTDYTFIKPSKNLYSYQYFWDKCFHIFILTALGDNDLAKNCLLSLFAMQNEDEFVGHIHYWNNVLPA